MTILHDRATDIQHDFNKVFYHQISQIKLRLNELIILIIEDKRDDEGGGGENEG